MQPPSKHTARSSMWLFRLVLMGMALFAISCGQQQQEPPTPEAPESPTTAFGTLAEVDEYLQAIDPYVRGVSQVQRDLYGAVGSSGSATGQNLAEQINASGAIAKLNQHIEGFSQLQPPALLAPLHTKIEKLMVLRVKAYQLTQEGWESERSNLTSDKYQQAEAQLREANELSAELNTNLQEVVQTLQSAKSEQQASKP